jgi:hypothetical protein
VLVDYEKVVLSLKAFVSAKPSHGREGLLAEISRLEAENALEEGLPEKALRLYGVVLTDALLRPALGSPSLGDSDGLDDPDRRSPAAATSDRRTNDGRRNGSPASAGSV